MTSNLAVVKELKNVSPRHQDHNEKEKGERNTSECLRMRTVLSQAPG